MRALTNRIWCRALRATLWIWGAVFLAPAIAVAQNVTLAWDPSPDSTVVGYTVHVGVNPGSYAQTFDVGGGTTSFTFTQAVPGQYYYFAVSAYTASNVHSVLSNEVSWKINVGPTFTNPGNLTSAVGAAVSIQLTAADDGDPLTYSAAGLPAGLSLNSSTGRITGTPTTAGTFTVGVTVSDGVLSSAGLFTWTINPLLAVTSLVSSLPSPQPSGTSITFTAAATGGVSPYQFKFLVSSNSGSSWTVVRNWAVGATYTWVPSTVNANYRVRVDARSAGVTADVAEGTAQVPFNITAIPPPTADSVTPASGSGASQVFQLKYSNAAGATGITTVWAWFTQTFSTTSAANSCMVYYDRAAARLNFLNNASTAWTQGTLGSTGTLQNSQCAVALAGSSVTVSGTTLTLNLAMTFAPAFSGTKNIYMDAGNVAGLTSGWPLRGSWSVPGSSTTPTVTADSVTPNSGSGATQTFAFRYSDSRGATSLSTTWAWFNATTSLTVSTNSCLAYYDRPTNILRLLNDAGTQWITGTVGSSGTLQNSQCGISLAGSSVSVSGTTLTLNLAMTFAPAFSGTKNIYMDAGSEGALTSGWPLRGSWTVPSGSTTPTVTADSVTPNAGSGSSQTFAFRYSDSQGATTLTTTWAWFNATGSLTVPTNSCLSYYDRATNIMRLLNDAATQWITGTVGSSGTLQNSQCGISLAGSSASVSGTTLTLNLAMTFAPAFSGTKDIYMDAGSVGGGTSGWPLRGSWTVQANGGTPTVTADSVTPNAGSGSSQTFAFRYSDSQGATTLTTTWAWFNATGSLTVPTNSCLSYYDRATNIMRLLNDAGTQWITGTVGSSGTLQNSQCGISLASSSVSVSGTTLTLNLAMTFAPAFSGTKNIYIDAGNVGGLTSGWPLRGSWTVP